MHKDIDMQWSYGSVDTDVKVKCLVQVKLNSYKWGTRLIDWPINLDVDMHHSKMSL